jgi:hypothetical protein
MVGETAGTFVVQVTDSVGNTATATLMLTVTAAQGQVLSGQQVVSGATIQIYTVGSTGNGSAATPMLTQTVTTDSLGFFYIAGDYTCGQSSNQVYIVATGGSTSLGSDNSALVMVAALGACSNLSSAPFIYVNELTTAATAWALAPFTTSSANIGASSTNAVGIANAFLDAALLANPTTGTTATLSPNLVVETGKLNALADALASCVNSNGTTACSPLFTAATPSAGTVPTDTFTAALNIVKNPGQNVAAVYGAIGSPAPYATTLIQAPNDWTMSLTVTGGGLDMPTALGVDSVGNVWVANENGPLTAFSPQGAPLSATGFGNNDGSEIAQVYGLAIDFYNNIWVTNYNGSNGTGSVTEFYGINPPSGAAVGTSPLSTSNSACYPTAVAADTNGDIFIANEECSSATVYDNSGTLVSGNVGANIGLPTKPYAIAIDTSHGFWLPGDNEVAHISAPSTAYPNGQLLSNANCCQMSYGVATDALGNLWVADYLGGVSPNNEGAFAELGSASSIGGDGSIIISGATVGGINHPAFVAVDAAQNVWFTNRLGASITEIAGNGGAIPAGTALSPTTGVYGVGGFGLDASIDEPYSIAPDRSGNLWVSNNSVYAVTMFFGLAAPTATPLQPVPMAP